MMYIPMLPPLAFRKKEGSARRVRKHDFAGHARRYHGTSQLHYSCIPRADTAGDGTDVQGAPR